MNSTPPFNVDLYSSENWLEEHSHSPYHNSKISHQTHTKSIASQHCSDTATYDAWNRLVKLEDDGTSNTVSKYEYDGAKRRTIQKSYVSGTLNETRHPTPFRKFGFVRFN